MKKIKLLLAAMAAMLGVQTAFAQQEPTDRGVYYLYNTESGLFLTRGNNWGTKAVTNEVGQPWQVSIADGKYTLRMYDLVVAGSTSGLGSDGFTDNGSPIAFTPSGSASGYTLTNGSNKLVSPASYGGNVLAANGNSTWQFLNVNEYKAVLAAKTSTQEAAVATAAGVTLGSSTLTDVVSDVDNWRSSDASASVPFPTKTDWSHDGVANRGGDDNEGTYGVETYQGGRTYAYTATGLAKGIYKVGVRALFRSVSNAACYTVGKAGYVNSSAYFSANGKVVQVKDWYSSCTSNSDPNSTGRFVEIANGGGYYTEVFTYVGDDGNLELKAVSESYWGSSWFLFNGVTLTYYTDQIADADITALIATIPAEGTVPTSVYSNLTSLKTTLESAKTIAAFNALSEAVTAANAMVAPYAVLVAEVAKAKALGIATATADAYLEGVTTAAQATDNTHALMVDEYNYVVANYTTAIDLGTWTTSNAGDMTSQHWDNTSTTSYNEQLNGWNQAIAWSTSYEQTITLPAGEYVFKVAGRHSQYSTLTLNVTAGETSLGSVSDFPVGDTGLGINTNGVTDFTTGEGHTYARGGAGGGWQWRYVPFTLATETAVTIAVNGNNPDAVQYQWCSFCNYTVQAKPSVAASRAAYEQAVTNANTALNNATYNNVGGTDRSNLTTAVAATPTETIEWYDAQTELITGYTTAFTAGVASWNNYVNKVTNKAKAEADFISSSIYTGLSLTAPTTAAEAASNAASDAAAIRVATANYVSSNFTYSLTGKIGDFFTWTKTATYTDGGGIHDDTPQTNNNQHWSATTRDYYEQGTNGWAASNGFNCTYTKTANLPVGNYVLKVAARASGAVVGTLSSTATANTVVLPSEGASSKGIDTSGAANFGDGTFANNGTGFGWEWRFLPFTVETAGEVTITIQESTTYTNNWFSLADAELLSDADKSTPVTLSEGSDMASTISTNDGELATVTLQRAIKVGYNTVCLPFDMTAVQVQDVFGASSIVYAFTEESENAHQVTVNFNSVGAGTISANVPVLVKATKATAANQENVIAGVIIVAPATDAKVAGTNFDFVGTYAASTDIAAGDYFISTDNEGNGHIYESEGNTTMKAFRAYLHDKSAPSAGVKTVRLFIEGVATRISEINGEAAENGAIFNLAGQRVNRAQKGIFIINGKKVIK